MSDSGAIVLADLPSSGSASSDGAVVVAQIGLDDENVNQLATKKQCTGEEQHALKCNCCPRKFSICVMISVVDRRHPSYRCKPCHAGVRVWIAQQSHRGPWLSRRCET